MIGSSGPFTRINWNGGTLKEWYRYRETKWKIVVSLKTARQI
jgi:hypothetical protein